MSRTADPHSSHVARLLQKQIGEKVFGCRHAIFIKLMVMFFCLFCSCSCTQVTPVTALTRLKSDRVSATQVQPGPLSCSLCPLRYPLGPLFCPPQYHLGPLSRPRFPLWSPQVLPLVPPTLVLSFRFDTICLAFIFSLQLLGI